MDHLPLYLEHLNARIRASGTQSAVVLPEEIASFCSSSPRECLALIIETLSHVSTPQLIQAIGDELLENLLNEHGGIIYADVEQSLRTNERFRQAFACGDYSSVDPALIAEWVEILRDLGTTKRAERKRLYSRRRG